MKNIVHPRWSATALSIALTASFCAGPSVWAQETDTWTGAGMLWSNSASWTYSSNGTSPQAGDTLVFTGSSTANNNNFAAGTAFDGLIFGSGASAFTLSGNSVLLSGQSNGNVAGILNNSSLTQTVGLSLSLDWGYYTFDSPAGEVVLSVLSPKTGAVAYFDNNIHTNSAVVSLSSDVSGLIAGLGGAGLTYSDTATTNGYEFTGLAGIAGGQIASYSGFPSVFSSPTGPIGATTAGSAVNIEISDAGPDSYSLAGGSGATFANTIFLSSGAANGLALGGSSGTLDLGAVSGVGGVYLPGGSTSLALTIGGGPSSFLTAGASTNTAGTIVFAVNGTGSAPQLNIDSTIANNGSGAVTVVSTGTGVTTLGNTANTYSGGTYIAQGELQGTNKASFGTGTVYVAGGATVCFETSGGPTVANNLELSPGLGAPSVPAYGAMINAGGGNSSTYTYSGTITLLGEAVAAAPGDRIVETGFGASGTSTGLGVAFTGLTTGTGTLDLYAAQSSYFILKYSGSNSYLGGIILEAAPGVDNLTRTGVNNQIPSGPGTGNMTLINNGGGSIIRFDVNGHLQTVNGLISTNHTNTAGQIVGNFQANGNSSSGTLTLGANGNNNGGPFTFYGTMSDQGPSKPTLGFNLAKTGTGTQTLAGPNPNTYIGFTAITNGVLALAGGATIADSTNILVFPGATLDASALTNSFDVVASTSLGVPQVLDCIGAINGGTNGVIVDGTISPFVSAIGTFTNIGSLTLDGGATYVWSMNNATGTVGADPGWGLVNVEGGVTINASAGSPMNINIASLNHDAPGSATNFTTSAAASWTILKSTAGITNFSASAFNLVTTSFSNNLSGGGFGIELSGDQKSLLLTFTPAASICSAPTNEFIVTGTTAQFTVGVCASAQPATYQWFFNSNPVNNGSPSGSGSTINIVSTGSESTLSIPNAADGDDGTYSVAVTGRIGGTPTTSATLTIIDAPSSLNVAESSPSGATLSGGDVNYLTVTPGSGTPPYSYVWSFDGNVISGATASALGIQLTAGSVGTYSVLVSNAAGFATNNQTVIPYVTEVPNQYIYESFDSYTAQNWDGATGVEPVPVSWEGVTNLYNEVTGEPAYWYNPNGGNSSSQMDVRAASSPNTRNGGSFPWPGLASDSSQGPSGSANELLWIGGEKIGNTADNHLHFTSETLPPGSKVYFSFVLNADNPSEAGLPNSGADVIFGLGGTGTDFTYKIATEVTSAENATNTQQFALGLFKGDGDNISLSESYGEWATNYTQIGQDILVVGCYTVVSGGTSATDDTVALWINPPTNTFYAGESNVPPPSLGPSGFGANNGPVNEVILRNLGLVIFYNMFDLRIGSTWASVTPTFGPTLSMANQQIVPGQTATFASQNAGDPVVTYSWQFNGGPALTDNTPNADGSYYLGSSTATLTIVNAQQAELGTYSVTGLNSDSYGNNYSGTASATLSLAQPTLSVAASGASAVITWPTNFAGFALEDTGSLASPASWTAVATNLITVVGTNNTASFNARTGDQYFRLHYHTP